MSSNPSPEKLALIRAAEVVGGQAALARVCGMPDRRHIWPYFNTDREFPADLCPDVEEETRAIAARDNDPSKIVTCEELCPAVKWRVLRENGTRKVRADGEEAASLATQPRDPGTPHDQRSDTEQFGAVSGDMLGHEVDQRTPTTPATTEG